jgi:subtilisin family serine protease
VSTSSPARGQEAITVAASDTTHKQASFSNFGSLVDLYPPGVGITSS